MMTVSAFPRACALLVAGALLLALASGAPRGALSILPPSPDCKKFSFCSKYAPAGGKTILLETPTDSGSLSPPVVATPDGPVPEGLDMVMTTLDYDGGDLRYTFAFQVRSSTNAGLRLCDGCG